MILPPVILYLLFGVFDLVSLSFARKEISASRSNFIGSVSIKNGFGVVFVTCLTFGDFRNILSLVSCFVV